MCEYAIDDLSNSNRDILAIYDPTCGTGSYAYGECTLF